MQKPTLLTITTPLPPGVSRDAAIDLLHDHESIIDLNPLVRARRRIPPPPHAPDEERGRAWYSVTDKLALVPGGLTYTCSFETLPRGLRTHAYAALGVDTRSAWSVGDEPSGLCLREDVELRCHVLLRCFVRRTIRESHEALGVRFAEEAARRSTAGVAGGS
ncbi:hypothetical protein E4U42_007968 [Claviceps africana]|uniref:DUF7053 domain-containing protein n=1 Tax=Claviceps africana TaxID=83212 RepID=A0A8K0J138_9HYPO|nr:hypothetical protein E4U42_007968 [Claviceps africana]